MEIGIFVACRVLSDCDPTPGRHGVSGATNQRIPQLGTGNCNLGEVRSNELIPG